ncbi:MAG: hypothetical protein U1A06_09550 [Hoeflea sp.]|nr:hypothetical protein [Hoeflea sp.]
MPCLANILPETHLSEIGQAATELPALARSHAEATGHWSTRSSSAIRRTVRELRTVMASEPNAADGTHEENPA